MLRGVRNEGLSARRVVAFQIGLCLVALGGAKLFSWMERGSSDWLGLPAELAGGFRYPGAVLGLIVGVPLLKWLIRPLSLSRYADILAPAVGIGAAVLRVSCFLNGCCTGVPCSGVMCLSYASGSEVSRLLGFATQPSVEVLPLNLLFLATSAAIGLGLLAIDSRRQFDGQIFFLYLFLHEGAKGLLELLRHPQVVELAYVSLSLSAVGAIALAASWFLGAVRSSNGEYREW